MRYELTPSQADIQDVVQIMFQVEGYETCIQYPKGNEISIMRQWLEEYVGEGYDPVLGNIHESDWAAVNLGQEPKEKIAVFFKDRNKAMYFKIVWC